MDIETECKQLELKLKGFCKPAIYINPETYDESDTKFYYALVQKILRSIPLSLQEILIEEGTFTPLEHFKDEEFFNVFAAVLRKNTDILKTLNVTVLPYDQWSRRTFSAMKMRMITAFVEILRTKEQAKNQKRAQEVVDAQLVSEVVAFQQQTQRSDGGYMPDFKELGTVQSDGFGCCNGENEITNIGETLKQRTKYSAGSVKMATEEANRQAMTSDLVNAHGSILDALQRVERKVDDLSSRLQHVEGIVRGLYVELGK